MSIAKIRNWRGSNNDVEWSDVGIVSGRGDLICMWGKGLFSNFVVRKGERWICVVGAIKSSSF